eukprot:g25616.t1
MFFEVRQNVAIFLGSYIVSGLRRTLPRCKVKSRKLWQRFVTSIKKISYTQATVASVSRAVSRSYSATKSLSLSMSTSAYQPPHEGNTIFFCCDIQESFRQVIPNMPKIIAGAKFLNGAAGMLGIPVVATEQKPFKPTVPELDLKSQPHVKLFQKGW